MTEEIEDSPEYLARWAEAFANAASHEELEAAIKSYRRIARTADDPTDRKIARRRAEALAKKTSIYH